MISYTFPNNNTTLQTVTNGLGFVGLTLNILGTSFGMLHALALQMSIRRIQEVMRSRETQQWDSGYGQKLIQMELSERKKFWMIRRHLLDTGINKPLGDHLDHLFPEEPAQFQALLQFANYMGFEPFRAIPVLGVDPTLAMGGGIMCLLMSVILFAVDSQHKSVWLACVSITVIVVSSMICSILVHNECESLVIFALQHTKMSSFVWIVEGNGMVYRILDTGIYVASDMESANGRGTV